MIIIEGAVVKEWFVDHKKVSEALVLIVSFLLIYYIFIRDSLQDYQNLLLSERDLQKQLMKTKKIIEQCDALRGAQKVKVAQFEKNLGIKGGFLSPSLSLSYFCRECGVLRYSISDINGSSGGHGRPILTLASQLNYSQALCVFSNLSKHSDSLDFRSMTLNHDENTRGLKLILNVEVASN
ncbi:MAG: hypothetical protein K2X50_07330 [Gammaproteobacteria bacterium]|nr:hypothetical protein [Gammaproteobacteria bacterium]